MNIIDIQVGNNYWLLTPEYYNDNTTRKECIDGIANLHYGKKSYEMLIHCILKKIHKRYHNNKKGMLPSIKTVINENIYCFYSPENSERYNFDLFQVTNFVFPERDDYLVFLVKADLRLKDNNSNVRIQFDDFFKNKIKESQYNHPQKWIF